MQQLKFIITDSLGLHARPAGQLVKVAAAFECDIRVGTADKMADAKRLLGVMGLALQPQQEVLVTFEGKDEEAAAEAMRRFLAEKVLP